MMENTLFSPGRFEREANEFAWLLLFDYEVARLIMMVILVGMLVRKGLWSRLGI
ncbi:hypothetical protein [Pelosinus sp. IPA-1]|uniref:hypothetical protein n=1 Tax=Pelosinus sp. IPA-1 TaxID=3029569 RepID=UPI0024362A1D|nr:hypothetical protein [Pelosinus sp. IPA-1]GMA99492.1 hypothetical protein PIPA1_22920 [Pelosinus sp. IPA-1]